MHATSVSATSVNSGRNFSTYCRSPVLALTLAALFWSGSFVVGRALRDSIDPVSITFLRWSISLLIFLPFVWREWIAHAHVVRREWRLVLGLAATGIALFHPLIFTALRHTSATNALLTLSLAPIVILILTSIGNRRCPRACELSGMALSMAGAAVLITRGHFAELAELNVGDLWMLAAVVVWAIYSLLLRRRPADLPQTVTLVSSIAVALPLLLVFSSALATTTTLHPTPAVAIGIAYIALFASVLSYQFWSYGVAEMGAVQAGQFVHLMPMFGAVLAFAFLGEPMSYAQVVGAALVLSGIALIEFGRG